MLPKPDACIGCPMYGDGQGFVPDRIPEGAKLLVLLQNPGKNEEEGRRVTGYEGPGHEVTEECPPQPLIGPTGFQFHKTFLPLTGVDPTEVGLANVLRCRLQTKVLVSPGYPVTEAHEDPDTGEMIAGSPGAEPVYKVERSDKMPTGETLRAAIEHCTRAYLRVPDSVRLIVAQGAHAWRLLGGPQPLDDWRGYLSPTDFGYNGMRDIPVFATVHLASLRDRPKLDLPTRQDFVKVGKILDGRWPKVWPELLNANTIDDMVLDNWFETAQRLAPFVVIDTEYDTDSKSLGLLGVYVPGLLPLQLHWWQPFTYPGRQDLFLARLVDLIGQVPAVFQNVLADMPVLRRACGITWESFKQIEDTMQAHAVLWCELPHKLEFQASMDSDYNKTKHLMGVDMDRYNAGDLVDTACAWRARLAEFLRDPLSKEVYRTQMRLLPHLDRAMEVGIAVDIDKVPPAIVKYQERVIVGERMAHAYCGWPVNLRSDDQMKVLLYEVEGLPVQKHPESKQPTTNADAIAVLRQRFYPFEPKEDETITPATVRDRIEKGGHPLIEAKVLHAHADHVLGHYLLPLVQNVK